MAKRGYKLQEFLAHSANVNCLSIGKNTSRLFITGGDDYKVNLWAIGKPTSLMSLCGHSSAVDSVAFDSAEVLVLAGASSGVIKLWDVEEAKSNTEEPTSLHKRRPEQSLLNFQRFAQSFTCLEPRFIDSNHIQLNLAVGINLVEYYASLCR